MLAAVFRRESGRVLAGLIRELGDFDAAEDVLQDALAKAAQVWPRDGVPDNPGAWLTTVARNRARDGLRRAARGIESHEAAPEFAAPDPEPEVPEADLLRLIFTCCHPALSPAAQVALTLRTLGGLSTFEIARAFLESEPATAQRLVRAKKKIREAKIPYAVPTGARLPERLEGVLSTLYLVFNEGYSASQGDSLIRRELCDEAIRLAQSLSELLPKEPEALGLLALMQLHHARRDARTTPAGDLIPLEEQDRSRWKQAEIEQATQTLDRAMTLRRPGPFQLQAAVAALHCAARRPQETDWRQIELLYGALLAVQRTPTIALNHAVAVAMSQGLDAGLALISRLDAQLADYHLLPAARADLLRRAGRFREAALAYEKALALVKNATERRYLERRLASLPSPR
jgi:RNA polymerase sigma-70 factor, ECF subfamily